MKKVRITAVRKTEYLDLIDRFENSIKFPCCIELNQSFTVCDLIKPQGFCDSAWETILPFVRYLACDEPEIFEGWMKDKSKALISCNDGFRPVSFLLEALSSEEC